MKVLFILLLSTSSFAASDLVNEFTKRRKVVQTRNHKEIYRFLTQFNKNPHEISKLELLNTRGKFALQMNNDDVCFGDTETSSLQCYNAIGIQTFLESGDLD
jgi:uncharacterized protein YprB with RNaseH-like and TPR domain